MAMTPPPSDLPTPYKLAVVGLAFSSEPGADKRKEIEDAVHAALTALPWVEVHQMYFMWNNVEIRVVPSNGQ